MGQAGLVGVGMALLRAIAIGTPDLGSAPIHQGPDHDGAPGRRGKMDNRLGAAKHPMIGVGALDPDARLVGGDDPGLAQRHDSLVTHGDEGALRPAQHGHEAALAVLSQTRFLLAYTSGPAVTGCCRINGLAPLPERQNGAENAPLGAIVMRLIADQDLCQPIDFLHHAVDLAVFQAIDRDVRQRPREEVAGRTQ